MQTSGTPSVQIDVVCEESLRDDSAKRHSEAGGYPMRHDLKNTDD